MDEQEQQKQKQVQEEKTGQTRQKKENQKEEFDWGYSSQELMLPSQGYFYDEDSPFSEGKVRIKPMTAKEEDLLMSQKLVQKGQVIDKLISKLLLDAEGNKVNISDLLIGDKNAIMIAIRVIGYGPQYQFNTQCTSCGETNEKNVRLDGIEHKEIDFDKFDPRQKEFQISELPISGKPIKFKLLRHRDQVDINQEKEQMKKFTKNTGIEKNVTLTLKHAITEIDGMRDNATIAKAVETMISQETRFVRDKINEVTPDVDLSYYFECEECGHEGTRTIPLQAKFFYPDADF